MSQNKKNTKKQKKGYYKKENEFQQEEPEKDRFEINSSDEEEKLPDFNYLLNLHSSSTSHLILKSDQEKFETESVINTSKYFNVDINLLNSSIKSIPFNEIHNIEGIEWSQDEIDRMNEVSKTNEEVYKTLLASLLTNQAPDESRSPEKLTKEIDSLKVSPQKETKKKVVEPPTLSDNKESMEKWLDDVLDL
ncbi:uncharacterized protein [Chironomus tepperi]|uniref:uncharacterized protein n=1 Tax=Chironomus tepperi TaxID=113505 RepID=UPI00391F356B